VSALRKLNHKNWDVKVAMADQGDLEEMNENNTPLEMNRVLLNKNPDEKMKKHGGSKAGSRVVPYHEESQDSVPVSNVPKDLFKNDKDSEELSLIRNQLQQIEKQQSSLLDLLQVCCQFLIPSLLSLYFKTLSFSVFIIFTCSICQSFNDEHLRHAPQYSCRNSLEAHKMECGL
jgi:hypothetical protein